MCGKCNSANYILVKWAVVTVKRHSTAVWRCVVVLVVCQLPLWPSTRRPARLGQWREEEKKKERNGHSNRKLGISTEPNRWPGEGRGWWTEWWSWPLQEQHSKAQNWKWRWWAVVAAVVVTVGQPKAPPPLKCIARGRTTNTQLLPTYHRTMLPQRRSFCLRLSQNLKEPRGTPHIVCV